MPSNRICCLVASPRRDGNSSRLAAALVEGAADAGHRAEVLHVGDFLRGFLGDCRRCRRPNGECGIKDNYRSLLLDHMLPADAIVLAAPVYWYGLPAQLKCVIDRLVCYTSGRFPGAAEVVQQLRGKRYALLLSSEESSLAMTGAIVQQMSDFSRYTHGSLVAVVNGVGNRRGEVVSDPADPLTQASRLGAEIFERRVTDYRIDTQRSGAVWHEGGAG